MAACLFLRALRVLVLVAAVSALPSIRFDHPTQDFEFAPLEKGGRASVVLALAALADPVWSAWTYETRLAHWDGGSWTVIIDINAVEVARWRAVDLINALGEVSAHITVPDLPPGEHVASCRLAHGDEERQDFESPEHTISFFVRDEPPVPPPETDIWTPTLCEACAEANTCFTATENAGDNTLVGDPSKAGGQACSGHGICRRGACLCAADWAGERCSHSILQNASFLPDRDPELEASRCVKSVAWELGDSDLRELFEASLPSDVMLCPMYQNRLAAGCHRSEREPAARRAGRCVHCLLYPFNQIL
jgi:hypothetical protein